MGHEIAGELGLDTGHPGPRAGFLLLYPLGRRLGIVHRPSWRKGSPDRAAGKFLRTGRRPASRRWIRPGTGDVAARPAESFERTRGPDGTGWSRCGCRESPRGRATSDSRYRLVAGSQANVVSRPRSAAVRSLGSAVASPRTASGATAGFAPSAHHGFQFGPQRAAGLEELFGSRITGAAVVWSRYWRRTTGPGILIPRGQTGHWTRRGTSSNSRVFAIGRGLPGRNRCRRSWRPSGPENSGRAPDGRGWIATTRC